MSRDGKRVAFLEDPAGVGIGGRVVVVDRDGGQTVLTREWPSARGIAWAPQGNEIWFTAAEERTSRSLYAVDSERRERLLLEAPGSLTIWDAAPDGRVLLSRDESRVSLVGLEPGGQQERDLSWFDSSALACLSRDGRSVLFGDRFGIYLRDTNGAPPVKLGFEGAYADDLSPDGKLVLATRSSGGELVILPTGAGAPRPVPRHQITLYSGAKWFPDGQRILFNGREAGRELRSYVMEPSGGPPRALTPEGTWAVALSSDGAFAAAIGPGHGIWVYPTAGGPSRPIHGSEPGDRPVAWSKDGRSLWVYKRGQVPAQVARLDIATGTRLEWKKLSPPDHAGVYSIFQFDITPTGDAYAYSYRHLLSQLYVVEGLQ